MTTQNEQPAKSALTLVPYANVQKLDETASHYQDAIQVCNHRFERAFLVAEAMIKLREQLTEDLMKPIMGLMNMRLGFLTDRSGRPGRGGEIAKPYPMEVVRDCAIEAMMHGVRLVDNEFNIISGGTYITRNGFTRKLREYPELTDLKIELGVPRNTPNGAGVIVHCEATWKLKGQASSLKADIPIRTDAGSTVDNILGKTDRKLKARIYAQITGSELGDGEVEDVPAGARDVSPGAEGQGGTVFTPLAETQPPAGEAAPAAPKPENSPPSQAPAGSTVVPPGEQAQVKGNTAADKAEPAPTNPPAQRRGEKPAPKLTVNSPGAIPPPAGPKPLSPDERRNLVDYVETQLVNSGMSLLKVYKELLKPDSPYAPKPPVAIDAGRDLKYQPDAVLIAARQYVDNPPKPAAPVD